MLNTDSGSLGFMADLFLEVMSHQSIRLSYYQLKYTDSLFLL